MIFFIELTILHCRVAVTIVTGRTWLSYYVWYIHGICKTCRFYDYIVEYIWIQKGNIFVWITYYWGKNSNFCDCVYLDWRVSVHAAFVVLAGTYASLGFSKCCHGKSCVPCHVVRAQMGDVNVDQSFILIVYIVHIYSILRVSTLCKLHNVQNILFVNCYTT
jgi:hypothetical protein